MQTNNAVRNALKNAKHCTFYNNGSIKTLCDKKDNALNGVMFTFYPKASDNDFSHIYEIITWYAGVRYGREIRSSYSGEIETDRLYYNNSIVYSKNDTYSVMVSVPFTILNEAYTMLHKLFEEAYGEVVSVDDVDYGGKRYVCNACLEVDESGEGTNYKEDIVYMIITFADSKSARKALKDRKVEIFTPEGITFSTMISKPAVCVNLNMVSIDNNGKCERTILKSVEETFNFFNNECNLVTCELCAKRVCENCIDKYSYNMCKPCYERLMSKEDKEMGKKLFEFVKAETNLFDAAYF